MSMSDSEKGVAKLIHIIVEHGNYVEAARIELARNVNFSPFVAFRRINRSTTGFITQDDLNSFLRQNGVNINEGGLKQFFSVEKDKSYGITYNNFLNQVLPLTDIDLRNSCLERSHKEINEIDQKGVDQLLATVYQKEYEYVRAIEGNKTKLLSLNNVLLDKAFHSLSDDVTGYLSFKSLSTFMKQNGMTFGKKEYENFMSRINRDLTSKITPIDFKYMFLPHGTTQNNFNKSLDQTHHKVGSIFNGISPIKNWDRSPNKNSDRKPLEASGIGRNERSLSPLDNRSNNLSPNGKSLWEPDRRANLSHIDPKYNSGLKNGNPLGHNKSINGMKSFNDAPSTRGVLYNQEIAAINDQLILQNAPEYNYSSKNPKNPLEWRYLDPVYHNYWNYHREHNRTLSPNYFNKAETYTALHKHHHGHSLSKPGTNAVPFFNPTFVDPGTYENLERYPDNPFRYTDHGHFFKNYYAGLRHNYYDKYYNYIPYKAKVSSTKSEVNSRNSPIRSRDASPPRPRFQLNPNPVVNPDEQNPNKSAKKDRNLAVQTNSRINRSQLDDYLEKPFRKGRDFSAEPANKQTSPQYVSNAPYEFVYVNDPSSQAEPNNNNNYHHPHPHPHPQEDNDMKSSIKIERDPFSVSPKLRHNVLKDFVIDDQPKQTNREELNNKPYIFVVTK